MVVVNLVIKRVNVGILTDLQVLVVICNVTRYGTKTKTHYTNQCSEKANVDSAKSCDESHTFVFILPSNPECIGL